MTKEENTDAILERIDQAPIERAARHAALQLTIAGCGTAIFTEGCGSVYRVMIIDQDWHAGNEHGERTYGGARFIMATDYGPAHPIPDHDLTGDPAGIHWGYVASNWGKYGGTFVSVVLAQFINHLGRQLQGEATPS